MIPQPDFGPKNSDPAKLLGRNTVTHELVYAPFACVECGCEARYLARGSERWLCSEHWQKERQ